MKTRQMAWSWPARSSRNIKFHIFIDWIYLCSSRRAILNIFIILFKLRSKETRAVWTLWNGEGCVWTTNESNKETCLGISIRLVCSEFAYTDLLKGEYWQQILFRINSQIVTWRQQTCWGRGLCRAHMNHPSYWLIYCEFIYLPFCPGYVPSVLSIFWTKEYALVVNSCKSVD